MIRVCVRGDLGRGSYCKNLQYKLEREREATAASVCQRCRLTSAVSSNGAVRDRLERALGQCFGLLVLNLPLFPVFSLHIVMALTIQILPLTIGRIMNHLLEQQALPCWIIQHALCIVTV